MKIGIIGTGNIGSGLAKRWAETGHSLLIGSRSADKAKALADQVGGGARAGSYQEAVDFGDVVVLATPLSGSEEILRGLTGLSGKILLETTNKFDSSIPQSSAELIASWASGAKVVKSFNTIFAQIIATPPGQRLEQSEAYLVGDDAAAKTAVTGLISDAGFKAVDIGGISNGHLLDKAAAFIIEMGYGRGMGTGVSLQIIRVIP